MREMWEGISCKLMAWVEKSVGSKCFKSLQAPDLSFSQLQTSPKEVAGSKKGNLDETDLFPQDLSQTNLLRHW